MADQMKLLKAQALHESELIICHGAKAVIARIRQARRMPRIAIAAQISADHGVLLCEQRSYGAPHRLGLRKAMQHEDRRAIGVLLTANDASDINAIDMHSARFKSWKHDEMLSNGAEMIFKR
jgi:hypothetical protein